MLKKLFLPQKKTESSSAELYALILAKLFIISKFGPKGYNQVQDVNSSIALKSVNSLSLVAPQMIFNLCNH